MKRKKKKWPKVWHSGQKKKNCLRPYLSFDNHEPTILMIRRRTNLFLCCTQLAWSGLWPLSAVLINTGHYPIIPFVCMFWWCDAWEICFFLCKQRDKSRPTKSRAGNHGPNWHEPFEMTMGYVRAKIITFCSGSFKLTGSRKKKEKKKEHGDNLNLAHQWPL